MMPRLFFVGAPSQLAQLTPKGWDGPLHPLGRGPQAEEGGVDKAQGWVLGLGSLTASAAGSQALEKVCFTSLWS